MIIIRKRDTGEVFDIPVDFIMQIDNTSPVFNELGSLVVSASIPNDSSGTNRRLLGFANRADVSQRPPSKIPVIVSSGSFTRIGSLTVNSATNSKKTFSCSIAFDEGEMYENMKDILLKDLTGLPVIEDSVPNIIARLNDLAHYDDPESELSVFPLYIDTFDNYESSDSDAFGTLFRLNRYKDEAPDYDLTDIDYYYNSSGERIEVSNLPGFGISPFLRVWKIIELIVAHLGYNMGRNPYKEHYQLRKLVALNNIADAIVAGKIDYQVLMPDVTMGDFLKSLFARHGARLFFNSNTRVVDIVLLKDILANKELLPFDSYQASPYDLVFTKAKQLKLTGQRSLYRTSVSQDTWEEFYKRYGGQIGSNPFIPSFAYGGIWYSQIQGVFYQTATTENARPKFISSIHFDWDKKVPDMDYEEISGQDECLTQSSIYADETQLVAPVFSTGPAFSYTGLLVNGAQSDEKTVTCPLAFAFSMGNAVSSVNFGSIFPHVPESYPDIQYYVDEEGNEYNYALTYSGKDGAFQRFFRDYDAFFRYSNHELTCDFKLPVVNLTNLNFQKKILLDNQPLLLDRVPHKLGAKETISVTARTTRLYQPYDLDADYAEPVSEGILYKWVRADDLEAAAETERANQEINWRKWAEDNPDKYRFISYTKIGKSDDVTKPSTELWFLPPTKEDFESGRKASKAIYITKYNYRHVWEYPDNGTWIIVNDDQQYKDVSYSSWLEAEPV